MTTFDLGPAVEVQQDDVIGFYGEGVPLDAGGTDADILSTPASADATLATAAAPAQGDAMTLGVDANYPLTSQDRTYSFAATVTPTARATARRRRPQSTRRPAGSPRSPSPSRAPATPPRRS